VSKLKSMLGGFFRMLLMSMGVSSPQKKTAAPVVRKNS
jgi:hypothetical protein